MALVWLVPVCLAAAAQPEEAMAANTAEQVCGTLEEQQGKGAFLLRLASRGRFCRVTKQWAAVGAVTALLGSLPLEEALRRQPLLALLE